MTFERMRADIASILDQPISAVQEGVNLLDLGLDSLRIMELAERWSRECGHMIEFASLAEHPEVSAWWRWVSGRTS